MVAGKMECDVGGCGDAEVGAQARPVLRQGGAQEANRTINVVRLLGPGPTSSSAHRSAGGHGGDGSAIGNGSQGILSFVKNHNSLKGC